MNSHKIWRLLHAIWTGVGLPIVIAAIVIVAVLQKEEFYGYVTTALIVYCLGHVVLTIGRFMTDKKPKDQ